MHIIKNGNKSLAVDAELNFTITSPIFEPREGSYVFNFTVPIPGNETFFEGAYRIEQKKRISKLENVGLYSGTGEYICIGDLIFQTSTDKVMKCMIAINNGSLNNTIQSELISSLSDIDRDKTCIDEVINGVFPSYDFAMFPVKNPSIYSAFKAYNDEILQNKWDAVSGGGWSFLSYDTGSLLTPFPYVGFILESIYKAAGFTIESNCFRTDPQLRKWCIYHNTLFRMTSDNKFSLFDCFPGYTIAEILQEIEDFFNVKGHISMIRKSVRIKKTDDVLNSTKVVDLTNKKISGHELTIDDEGDGYLLTFKTPDDTYYTEHVKDILSGGYNILDPVQTTDDLPREEYPGYTSKDIVLVISEDQYYASQINVDPATGETYLVWRFFSENIIPLTDGDEDVQLETAAPILTSIYDLGVGGLGSALTPVVDIEGNAEYVSGGAERKQTDIRFLSYIGMQPSTVIDIPTGSSDVYNKNGDVVSGLAARWDGPYGRYEKLFKKTVYFLQKNRPVEFSFLLTDREARDLETDQIYQVDNMKYIIESREYISTGKGYVRVSMKMRSVL